MQLRSKLIFNMLILTFVLAALAAVMMWGVYGLSRDVTLTSNEYDTLREIYKINGRVVLAQVQLAQDEPDHQRAVRLIRDARKELKVFHASAKTREFGKAERREKILASIDDALEVLASVENNLTNPMLALDQTAIRNSAVRLNSVVQNLNELDAETGEAVIAVQENALLRRQATALTVSIVMVVAFMLTLLLGVIQYRSVMVPLNRMRLGVRKLAKGNFTGKLESKGNDEFADLSHEFNRMAAELEELYQDLEGKVRDKSKELARSERLASVGFFAAGVAHEINNPLGVISGHAELSLGKLGRAITKSSIADTEESLLIIREEAFRCKGIIEKLLNLSRVGDDSKGNLDLNEVAEEVSGLIQGLKRFSRKELKLELAEKAGPVLANSGEMKQVLLNLVVNAMDSVDDEGGQVTVRTRLLGTEHAELEVEDNGKGMAPEIQEKIFEPFFTTKKGRNEGSGSGLGLSITHAIVKDHNGMIQVHSDGEGHGCIFTIQLPTVTQGGRLMFELSGETNSEGLRVLVVEDEPNLRDLLCRAIPDMGFTVGGVGKAEDARDLMAEKTCQIVILDINLPGMSGLEFLAIIRERWPDTQVIVMTGYGDLEMAQEAIRLNVADFLTKPTTLRDLEMALDRARGKIIRKLDPDQLLNIRKEDAAAEEKLELMDEVEDDEVLTLADLERRHILAALDRHEGNRQAAAKELGISVRKLYYRLDEYRSTD